MLEEDENREVRARGPASDQGPSTTKTLDSATKGLIERILHLENEFTGALEKLWCKTTGAGNRWGDFLKHIRNVVRSQDLGLPS
jgi:hypothetical protein